MHTKQNKGPQNGNSRSCEAQEETCFAKALKKLELVCLGDAEGSAQPRAGITVLSGS